MKEIVNERVSEKILKLSELAIRGVGGEALNAKRALTRLLNKYGIKLEDLLEDNPKDRVFPYKTADERSILCWIITHNLGSKSKAFQTATYDSKRKVLFISLKDTDYIDIRGAFDFYRAQYRKELARLTKDLKAAFVHKHGLYDRDPREADKGSSYSTKDILRILSMSDDLEEVSYRKQIEG